MLGSPFMNEGNLPMRSLYGLTPNGHGGVLVRVLAEGWKSEFLACSAIYWGAVSAGQEEGWGGMFFWGDIP